MDQLEKEKKIAKLLEDHPPMMGQIVYHLSPKSNKPIMPAIIVQVRQDADSLTRGVVDLHVFHPNSSGTNIVYGVPVSEKEESGSWWHLPSLQDHKSHQKALSESRLDVIKKTEDSFRKQNQAALKELERRTK